MDDYRRYQLNRADVAAKVIDGEAIVMNVSSGAYYSITGAGADIWELLEAGSSIAETVAFMADRYDVPDDVVAGDVGTLLASLLDEGLLVESAGSAVPPEAPVPAAGGAGPYRPPSFEKFTDMAEMLALDPPMPELDEELFLEAGTRNL
jgi:hypothetical protein